MLSLLGFLGAKTSRFGSGKPITQRRHLFNIHAKSVTFSWEVGLDW